MLKLIKSYLPKLIIDIIYKYLHFYRLFFLKGNNFFCPICKFKASKFLPYGKDYEAIKKFKIIGMGFRENAICPNCFSKDRERLSYLFLESLISKKSINFSSKILHFSPENSLERNFFRKKFSNYFTADIIKNKSDFVIDLQNFNFKEKNFDLVICNHVLEHIEDDILALKNIFSILKPGGIAILQAPVSTIIDIDFKKEGVTSNADRLKFYGQTDHVRIYSEKNFLQKIKNIGFEFNINEMINEKNNLPSYGLNKMEKVIFATK
tara:strand:+ start:45 stop:839 length:795 start_codon:yes stop_codon:yes gene_type:complete